MVWAPVQSMYCYELLPRTGKRKIIYHDDQDPNFPVLEANLAGFPVTELFSGTLGRRHTVISETLRSDESLGVGETLGGGWPVRKNHPGEETKSGGSDTLDQLQVSIISDSWRHRWTYEKPLPSSKSSCTIQVFGDETSEKTGEGTSDGGGGVVNGETTCKFVSLVPG